MLQGIPSLMVSRGTIGGTPTCPDDGSPSISCETLSNDNEFYPGASTDRFYLGQGAYVDATTRTICKVGFYFGGITGTISGKHYEVKIWPMSGNNLGTILTNGTSDALTGITTSGWKMFSWSGAKPVMTGGTAYAITISPQEAADGANFPKVWEDTPVSLSGNAMAWNTSFGRDADFPTYTANIRLYWFA